MNIDNLNSTKRFSDRVKDYIAYRPNYPKEIISYMSSNLGLSPAKVIVDIGSGTGISSKLFLDNGNMVYGVEPNREMREAAEEFLEEYGDKFISVNGISESINLPNQTADFIIAAQAFHWFEPIATKKEFNRILKNKGLVVLIWNNRKTSGSAFLEEYEKLINEFGIDYQKVKDQRDEKQIQNFFETKNYGSHCFYNYKNFDFKSLVGLVTSYSYMPNRNHPNYKKIRISLKNIFEKYKKNGVVRMEYDTQLYFQN